jgi:hypothetical protein
MPAKTKMSGKKQLESGKQISSNAENLKEK